MPGASDEKLKVTTVEGIDPEQSSITGAGDGKSGHADFCMLRVNLKDLEELRKKNAHFDVG